MAKAKKFEHNPGNTAICYYRYSSNAQRYVSIEDQRNEAHKYAEARHYHIIKEYEDHALSAKTDDYNERREARPLPLFYNAVDKGT